MTLEVYIGKTPVEKIFLGTSQLPKVSLGGHGFTTGSKLSADFTTDTYKADGAAKTFADLFTFTRAGKAWLVKETGLQEYAADVPRLDNGLLIEQSATNLALNSAINSDEKYNKYGDASYSTNGLLFPAKTAISAFTQVVAVSTGNTYVLRAWFDRPVIGYPKTNSEFQLSYGGASYPQVFDAENNSNWSQVIPSSSSTSFGVRRISADSNTDNPFTVKRMQVEQSSYPSSFIPTTATPVTRPADYLLNKITGTTVTGDWDSTLTLSIVAGNLVHSGYGRIRSLEIN